MFDTIYSANVTPRQFFLMAVAALSAGLISSWIMSFRVRTSGRFFPVTAMLPVIVAAVITFVNGNIGAGVAIGGAFGLVRFRSAPGTSDELAAILISMTGGIAFGMGYLGYGAIILVGMAAIYSLMASVALFEHRNMAEDLLLQITIPESLQYTGMFDDLFEKYLESVQSVGVKTTGMGSMFKLTYKIRMKRRDEEKAFIDEIRTRNGNLEISIVPFSETAVQL
ncbi:MAG: DUF4956 domain-containing protein [Erysipelotrichaceae bacterium]|nr:DUF4956 domain-containing protein [Erysipelotrichaceae bacterium]